MSKDAVQATPFDDHRHWWELLIGDIGAADSFPVMLDVVRKLHS